MLRVLRGLLEIRLMNASDENDILYIKPLAVHQLKATGDGVFGFYCIVDRVRDKPQTPY